MAKHTPGPWTTEKRDGDEWWFGGEDGAEIVIRTTSSKYDAVAVIGASLSEKGAADADARLIAAAPELLEALRHCVDWAKALGADEQRTPHLLQAKAAILKATGEQQ